MLTDYETYSDAQLLQRYQKGDEVARNVLFQRYRAPLHKFFRRRISGNHEDAEDLVQETLLEALKSLEGIQSPERFGAWLSTIATRVLVKWIKEKQKQGVLVVLDADPEDESGQMALTELLSAPVTFQPEHGVLDNELAEIRRRFECTLRPKELEVFQLRHNSDMTFEEIRQKLGIRTGTAKSRYHRALVKFEKWLEKHYPDIYHFLRGGGE
ncbi:MAG: RNA polymerase sigma factor [Candidatus Poribacteria bacterium]|nr:RNA polymerase sigma factor [Candidatus Poribacteria bacterium]